VGGRKSNQSLILKHDRLREREKKRDRDWEKEREREKKRDRDWEKKERERERGRRNLIKSFEQLDVRAKTMLLDLRFVDWANRMWPDQLVQERDFCLLVGVRCFSLSVSFHWKRSLNWEKKTTQSDRLLGHTTPSGRLL